VKLIAFGAMGANAAATANLNPIGGAVLGAGLSTISNTSWAGTTAGSVALAASYALLGISSLNFDPLIDKLGISGMMRYAKAKKWGAEWRARGGTFEEYMGTKEEQRQEFGPKGQAYEPPSIYTPPPAPVGPIGGVGAIQSTPISGVDVKASRYL